MKRINKQEIRIPREMDEEVEKLIKTKPELGYKTAREFVITACFLQILRIREESAE
ncbi:MAG: hypothetical protein ACPLW8_06475 [Candidatus Bathyarchaeales archaeon]